MPSKTIILNTRSKKRKFKKENNSLTSDLTLGGDTLISKTVSINEKKTAVKRRLLRKLLERKLQKKTNK
jgi:hypothetical protein